MIQYKYASHGKFVKKIILSLGLILGLGVLVSCSCGTTGPTEPPTSTNQPPIITNQSFSVSDSISDTNVIGMVVAIDPEDQALVYSILTNDDDVKFEINKTNGSLSLSNEQSLDFSISTNHRLVVSVSDGELSSNATVTINVINNGLFYDITTTSTYEVFTNVRQYSNLTTFTPTLISNFEMVDFVGDLSNTNLFVGTSEILVSGIESNILGTVIVTNTNKRFTVMSNANSLLSNVMLSTINFVTNDVVTNIVVMNIFETNDSVTNVSNNIQNTDNLSNVDLSSFVLNNLDFSGYNLIDANLINANLSNANLIGANLSNANFIAFENKFGATGTNDGQFSAVTSIAVGDSFIYVVDNNRDDVQIFNKSNQEYVTNFGDDAAKSNTDNGQFKNPIGIAIDDNFIYVTDINRDDVQIFNKSNQGYVTKFGTNGTNNGPFLTPQGIDVDDSYIYILDNERNDVQVFDKSNQTYITNFGINNGENLYAPRGIAVDDDFIYIAATINGMPAGEVILFEKNNYSFSTKFGNVDFDNRDFFENDSIAVDDNFIYVTDADARRLNVQVFNKSDLSYITKVESTDTGDIQFAPRYVVVDNGFIYIVSRSGAINEVYILSSSLRGAILE